MKPQTKRIMNVGICSAIVCVVFIIISANIQNMAFSIFTGFIAIVSGIFCIVMIGMFVVEYLDIGNNT